MYDINVIVNKVACTLVRAKYFSQSFSPPPLKKFLRAPPTTAEGRIRPSYLFNSSRQKPCTFFQAPRFRLWTAVQQHWLLPVT